MRLRIVLIFLVAILIPTALLAYFGLLAIRSEKSIIEKNMRQNYEAMADVVATEVKRTLKEKGQNLLNDTIALESILLEEASLFRDHIAIFNKDGKAIGPVTDIKSRKLVLSRQIKNTPYSIGVFYERYPLLQKTLKLREKRVYLYAGIIIFSAFFILGGGFFTLWQLSREWQKALIKSDFVSHLSHDLRRPLTSVRMFSEMLQDNRVPSEEKKKEYCSIIASESERLTHLANNILDFSRIERGRRRYSFKHEDITVVVRETIERFKKYIASESRPINLHKTCDFPMIRMDTGAISQALMNLLLNATKYSPPDKEITVNLIKKRKEVVIEVIDRGIGIPRKEQKKIFQKFYRVSRKDVAESEGSGLGLTLVKWTALAHKGRVLVESEEGKGSKFSLILPM
jgi:signal transduction histidine kinase